MSFLTWLKSLFATMPTPSKSAADGAALVGDGTWPWQAQVDGEDIVILNARATCFGGASDPQDSGETASGVNTKTHPDILGCALPLQRDSLEALRGSPLPGKIPFRTMVEVRDLATGRSVTVPIIDLGPGKRTGNAVDLTVAAARQFNSKATAKNFSARVDVRILGAARYA